MAKPPQPQAHEQGQLMRLPHILRVLIIDDKVKSSEAFQERISSLILHYAFGVNAKSLDWVDVKFAGTPEKGATLWQEEAFDITLIDSDFSKNKQETSKQTFLDIDVKYKGAYLFVLLNSLKKENYAYRKHCEMYMWTGLKNGELEEVIQRIQAQPSFKDSDEKDFLIRKQEKSINRLKEIIQEAVKKVSAPEANFSLKETVERFITFYKTHGIRRLQNLERYKDTANNLVPLIDGYLICTSDNRFDYVFPKLECKPDASENKNVYLSLRKTPIEKYNDLRYLYLGPSSRADNLPLYKDIETLFPDKSENQQPEYKHPQEKILPLSTEVRLDLLYRKNPFNVPKPNPNLKKSRQRIIAAATPLTGISATGEAHAIQVLKKKIVALLDGPFEKVVLKTVYLDKLDHWDHIRWPELQAQSHHRCRCLRSTGHPRTLWNTGSTAMEMLTPKMMNELLKKRELLEQHNRIIVSLGSKYPQHDLKSKCYRAIPATFHEPAFRKDLKEVWKKLFDTVFEDIDDKKFEMVEINVRHYLRECVAFHLGGNEYLSPSEVDGPFAKNYENVEKEFRCWLRVLDDVARDKDKKLLLKLPFRGDILFFIKIIKKFYEGNNTAIKGVTLINAFKSGVCDHEEETPLYSPAWYGQLRAWEQDGKGRAWTYQMSGEMLNASRNELLGSVCKALHNDHFELHVSGGIMNRRDIKFCQNPPENSKKITLKVQLGTWPLMELNLAEQHWEACRAISSSTGNGKLVVDEEKCKGCGKCEVICAPKAKAITMIAKKAYIDSDKCKKCFECKSVCPQNAISQKNSVAKQLKQRGLEKQKIPPENFISPRIAFCLHELCDGCGVCSRTFYCDTFLDREGKDRFPLMDPRNCTGCGLCVQSCPKGAIQLFESKHVLTLISTYGERSDLLNALQIPHLVLDSNDVIWKRFGIPVFNGTANHEVLFTWAKKLWFDRLADDQFALGTIYQDDRWPYLHLEQRSFEKRLFEKVETQDNEAVKEEIERAAEARLNGVFVDFNTKCQVIKDDTTRENLLHEAFVWYNLIMSDPGQVLKESPVLLMKFMRKEVPSDVSMVITSLTDMRQQPRNITVCGVLFYHLNDKLEIEVVLRDVKTCQVPKNFNVNYYASTLDLGKDRLYGLDIRACPAMLKTVNEKGNETSLTVEEVLTISGLPWEQLKKIEPIAEIRNEVYKRLHAMRDLS